MQLIITLTLAAGSALVYQSDSMPIMLKNEREIVLVKTLVRSRNSYQHWARTEQTKKYIQDASNWLSIDDNREILSKLRNIYTNEKTDPWDRFAVALELAWHNDSTGAKLLREVAGFNSNTKGAHFGSVYTTNSGHEIIDSAVALLILGEKLPGSFRFKNKINSMAYRFLDELATK